ncbi:acyltransferase family protein [Levilactobacillus tujiorum]|uniref:acyltransferase family protein n=1 Tax=Levilactobacillus tujiorum TaxID=2912243 RepID=UPI00145756D9|nr:acyltransferase family protein [Levilactobacillus tujiorum]NLR32872.1 acyltransferase [Levilactobacillus tujiorum]
MPRFVFPQIIPEFLVFRQSLVETIFFASSGYLNWFVTAYIIMYILSPFLNILILRLSRKQFQMLLVIFLMLSLSLTVFHNPSVGTTGDDSVWLIIVYFFGAYVRLFKEDLENISSTVYLRIFFGCMMFLIFSTFGLFYIQSKFGLDAGNNLYKRLLSGFSPVQLIAAFCLFLVFIRAKPFVNRRINKIASTMFAVYLIHDNGLVSEWLWNRVILGSRFQNSWFVLMYAVVAAVIIFVICSLIDIIRQFLLSGVEKRVVEKIASFKVFKEVD